MRERDGLRRTRCLECKKRIKVAEYTPHPREQEATGMAANIWTDGDLGTPEPKFIGWICNECAWSHTRVGGGGGIGGCGYWAEFIYDRYPPPSDSNGGA